MTEIRSGTTRAVAVIAVVMLLMFGGTGWVASGATIAHILSAAGLAACL